MLCPHILIQLLAVLILLQPHIHISTCSSLHCERSARSQFVLTFEKSWHFTTQNRHWTLRGGPAHQLTPQHWPQHGIAAHQHQHGIAARTNISMELLHIASTSPPPNATHCNRHPSSNLALSAMTNSCMLDITSPSISPLTDMKLC
jgi:hypothetical protein